MLGRQFELFRLLGFKIQLDLSWLLLAGLITWSLATGVFPTYYAGLGETAYWSMGILGMLGLFASLVLHELSHSIVARHYGLPIRAITLFIFGGVAEMTREPATAKAEFRMAIAGPIASALLALGFYVLAGLGTAAALPQPLTGVLYYLAIINAVLAAFNMLPAFPLDGGRVLRAALWHYRKDLRWATRVAATSGEVFGVLLIVLGVLSILQGDLIGGIWWCLIGLFLRSAAAGSYTQLMTQRTFEHQPVARFMTPEPIAVAPETTLKELVDDYLYRHHHDLFPVVRDHQVIGLITPREVRAVPRDHWLLTSVSAVMIPLAEAHCIGPDEDAFKALVRMRQSGSSRLLVIAHGRLLGIVTLKDLLDYLTLRQDLGDFG
jgi:Zn-dependent protease